MRIRTLVVAFAIAGALAPASAYAHAQLESTSPGRDATVAAEPPTVSFTFGEPVTGTAGAVRVYDARGDRVDDGAATHPNGHDRTLAVGLKPGLADGTYTATYRVVSADTHVVTGGFVFSIGHATGPGETVGQLLAGQKTGAVTNWAFVAARAMQYGAIGIGAGGLLFLLAVWLSAAAAVSAPASARNAARARQRRLLLGVAAVGLLSALVGLVLEGAEAAGVSFWDALTSTIIGDVLDTRFGVVWAVAAGAWVLVGAGAAVLLAPRRDERPPWLLAVPLVALLALPALAGHASIQSPVWLFLPANLLHVSAMSAWFGGLVALLFVVPGATRQLAPTERTRLLAAVLLRFSPIALGAVCVLLATGVVQSLIEIDAWSQLLDTPFGRAVLIKFLLLMVLIGLGAINRQRTVPRLRALAQEDKTPGESGVLLRRTLRAEVILVVVVLTVTGALAGYPPAKTAATGPVSVNTTIGPEELSVDVDPARVGANVVHIYILNPKTGAQFAATKELTVTATLPSKGIGPLPLKADLTGPGHWTIPSAVFGAPGPWKVDVTARVSAFDEYEKQFDVPIR